MDVHAWIDIVSIVGLVAATVGGVVLASRLAQHQKLEDKVNEHDKRLEAHQAIIDLITATFRLK